MDTSPQVNRKFTKMQKFWHCQITVIFEGEIYSCDCRISASSAKTAENVLISDLYEELIQLKFGGSLVYYKPDPWDKGLEDVRKGIQFQRIVLTTNPSLMCAGGVGFRIPGKSPIDTENKESTVNRNPG